ncbi:MAG: PHP-associated domain-containing protein [Candidatus Nanoarchaeia archaeon]
MVLVKADLHIHTSEDIKDRYIKHSAKKLIDEASERGINVVAVTLHEYVLPVKNLKSYAAKKGILLIQGVEAKIEGKHVLIYNISPANFSKIKTFNDLRKLKKENKNIFVIAPHPFVPVNFFTKTWTGTCLQNKYFENKDLFDALEFQQFYSFFFNPNKKTSKVAKNDKKPIIANTDSHFLRFFGEHYSVVDVKGKLNEKNFFAAVNQNRVNVVSNVSLLKFTDMTFSYFFKR